MKPQTISLLFFLSFIITTCASAMEQSDNNLHPLLHLPVEIQQQIVFPWDINDTKINPKKMNELKQIAKTFFVFNILSKDFNQRFKFPSKLPWSTLDLSKKNKMLEDVIDYMTVLDYKMYRIVTLVLVYSGADADIKPEHFNTSLFEAVREDDETAVAMLLEHGADPYQTDNKFGKPICFYASTVAIAQLFLKKIDDKEKLLSKYNCIGDLFGSNYPAELMTFWFDYGVNLRHIYSGSNNDCLWHCLVRSLDSYANTMENIRVKGELLLEHIPDMINTINASGETPLDAAMRRNEENNCCLRGAHNELIKLLRKHGAKTAQELEEENKQRIKQQEAHEITNI